jgi:hypothetical protein
MFRFIALFACAFVVACSGPAASNDVAPAAVDVRPATVAVCIASDVPEAGEIVRAIDLWNAALGGQLVLAPEIADTCTGREPSIRVQHDCGGGIHAACEFGGVYEDFAEIHFDQLNLISGKTFGVALHEIGHMLGAGHTEGTFMAPKYTKDWATRTCIDAPVAAEVGAVLGFSVIGCPEQTQ